MVIKDLKQRASIGETRYGEQLRSRNGRRAAIDAYQEALDMVNYLRQLVDELEDLFDLLLRWDDAFGDPIPTVSNVLIIRDLRKWVAKVLRPSAS